MHNIESEQNKFIQIDFKIPNEMCTLDAEQIECVPELGYKKKM